MPDPKQVAAIFDDWADRGRAEGMERGHAVAARAGFDWLGISDLGDGARYLDIGCGNGYSVRWAAATGAEALGIDVSEHMIARAEERSRDVPGARFIHGAFPSDALAPGSFDRILSMEVFYYLPDLGVALAAARKLLRPSGRFVCIVDHYGENAASHAWGPDMDLDLHLLSQAEWAEAMRRAGFSSVEQSRVRLDRAERDSDRWKVEQGSLLTAASA